MKVPDTSRSLVEPSLSMKECEEECLKNCNCTAYARANNISEGGSRCLMWFGASIDLRVNSDQGLEIYARVAGSDLSE